VHCRGARETGPPPGIPNRITGSRLIFGRFGCFELFERRIPSLDTISITANGSILRQRDACSIARTSDFGPN
jgi:hypothetical protein